MKQNVISTLTLLGVLLFSTACGSNGTEFEGTWVIKNLGGNGLDYFVTIEIARDEGDKYYVDLGGLIEGFKKPESHRPNAIYNDAQLTVENQAGTAKITAIIDNKTGALMIVGNEFEKTDPKIVATKKAESKVQGMCQDIAHALTAVTIDTPYNPADPPTYEQMKAYGFRPDPELLYSKITWLQGQDKNYGPTFVVGHKNIEDAIYFYDNINYSGVLPAKGEYSKYKDVKLFPLD